MHLLESLARWAWETSLAASLLAVVALGAKFILRKPVFTPIRYMLGLLVVARLLMPFSIPSPFSVFNLFQDQRFESLAPAAPAEQIKVVQLSTSVRPLSVPHRQFQPLPILWIAICVAILGRVFIQQFRVRRSLKAATEISAGPSFEALERSREIMGCRRKIRLHALPGISSPALFGIFRPAILLPTEFAASATPTQLRLVYLHEIAHLRRLDVPINWLMIFAQAIHWFNPLVWLTMRRLRADQELLCDGYVMRILRPEEHHTYGETLLAIASPRHAPLSTLIPISSSFKQLKERIAMITQFKPLRHRLLLFALPLAAILAVLTFTAAVDKRSPKRPSETKDSSAAQTIETLTRALEMQTDRVKDAEGKVDALRQSLHLAPFNTEMELYSENAETRRHIETDRLRAQQEYRQFSELYARLKAKSRDELLQIIPTASPDAALEELLKKLNASQQQLAVMQVDYSDEHAEVRRLKALIKTLNGQIDERVKGILGGIEAMISAKERINDELRKMGDSMAVDQSRRVSDSAPYFRALRDLETQRRLYESISLRLMQEKLNTQVGSR